ncbi:MAG: flagellar basal body rod protein FlgC [Spirochaetes bacterium]|jgi:flagellar basal-body rod protein FlgC|nr:flagellar basal body rod protein FlgC [Brevinematales bacterium]MCL1960040.1 flagellar basal body rod protein FlgC [Spirochaetota bacterium]
MGIFSSINIAATGLSANRVRLDVIADNMANVNTTRTTEGGPFRRSRVIMRPRVDSPYWRSPFLPETMDNGIGQGVRVAEIQKDYKTEHTYRWDPTHPDAIQIGPRQGYVELPNVDVVTEMVDMISASRSYEANASIIDGSKSMFQRALEIGSK